MKTNEVWTFIEIINNKIADVSLELISKANELAKNLKVKTGAVLPGHNVKQYADQLHKYGADKVYIIEDEKLKNYTTLPYAKVMTDIIKEYQPQIVLYGATTTGRDLAPRIASELKVGLTADCTNLKIGDYADREQEYSNILYQIRPAFGGNIIATIVSPKHRPQMATVREGVMKKNETQSSAKGEILAFKADIPQSLSMTEIVKKIQQEKSVDLKAANIIVSGGIGVGTKDNFELIHQLAHAIGGEVGGSRAAVDAGFVGKDHQVGQTGTTVRPRLYIAVGISGQIQHMAGMHEASRIIAINNDPNAPIFQIAHYGIIGDLNDVIPRMIKEYDKLKK
ncbi:MAG: electron transfer flavoprotein subunit alpha/FixB family protein [Spirochaetes bacterium]|nr:electron transfer flavoprotein subunit alpha/FixB family protein [Spirochaetota bacterium]